MYKKALESKDKLIFDRKQKIKQALEGFSSRLLSIAMRGLMKALNTRRKGDS